MPQLDFSMWPPQIIWLVITFGILYMVISKFALPKIGGAIESRQNRIASDLDEAQRLKDESERAIAAYETALAEAKAKAHGIAQETRDTLKAEIEAERNALDAKLNERLAEAEARISATKADALKSVEEVAGEAAGAIVSRLIGKKASSADIKKAVADAS